MSPEVGTAVAGSQDPTLSPEPPMNPLLRRLSPKATHMIRMDHSHVLTAFHQYDEDASPAQRKALANTVCLALEVHAQLEEEIFYPALLALEPDGAVLAKSVPEHDEMRRLIACDVNGIVTNRPAALAEVIRDLQASAVSR